METKVGQTLRPLGYGVRLSLPTTMPLRQTLPLPMAIILVWQSLLEIGRDPNHSYPLISVPWLIPRMSDTLPILLQARSHPQLPEAAYRLLLPPLPLLHHRPLLVTHFPLLIAHSLVLETQSFTGVAGCLPPDMLTKPHILMIFLLDIYPHQCRITTVNHHPQCLKASLQSRNLYLLSALASLGPQNITDPQAAARQFQVRAKTPRVR
jgi:hypothetical protein